jgi:hypothetical protein
MNRKTVLLKVFCCVLVLLLVVSTFKNISYPLFWGDESMTAMGAERVAEYGYPKAHDGKNVLNDMFCGTPKVAVNPKDDAFIGGANWGQYYFGVIGYLLASQSNDIYIKTGIFRAAFAVIGLLGLLFLAYAMSKFLSDSFYKYLFIVIFLFAEIISVSMVLHLRQVRYYSPALFFSSALICLYVHYRFYKPFNKIIFTSILIVMLLSMFNMFSPLYFVFILAIGLSESIIGISGYMETKNLRETIIPCMPSIIAMVISYLVVYPLLVYFKTFEMKAVLDSFYHFNTALYWVHFKDELSYFSRLELLWLALAMKVGVLINLKKAIQLKSKLCRVSNFLSLLFFVSLFAMPDIDSPMFTRYIIFMQPVLVIIAIFDFIFLLNVYSLPLINFWNSKILITIGAFVALFGFSVVENFPYITGHIYELNHQYKGPLDYTIPYIQSHYPHPGQLTIAANCDESPYMYYLNSKVTVGFVGNNLPEDTLFQPDIIAYRKSVGTFFPAVFNGFLRTASYREVLFPAKDMPANTIPELSFDMQSFNHSFKSVTTDNKQEETSLYIKI